MALWVGRFPESVHKVDHLVKVINLLGKNLDANFASEGGAKGKSWQRLSGMTQDLREQRGFEREHPIMQQTGGLRSVSTAPLIGARSGGSHSYTKSTTGAALVASYDYRSFRAQITGDKVANNRGGYIPFTSTQRRGKKTRMYLPPRPFFFIPAAINDIMWGVFCNSLLLDWKTLAPSILKTRIGYGAMYTVASNAKSSRGKVPI